MCGICGAIEPGRRDLAEVAESMANVLGHRGPDDAGVASGSGWSLGFRRLSILDTSPLGHQPMESPDGRFWLAFNGEIYNYLELRAELEADGERFRGGSDSEVLLRLLMRRGAQALESLNGMFALAFVDTRQRTFLLARDRLGVKPLYVETRPGGLRFASELKALLRAREGAPEISRDAVARYLALGYLPTETCVVAGVEKLPPGSVMTGSLSDPAASRPHRYWSLHLNADPVRRSATALELDELEYLLADAVRIRMRSDVPVGVFLSGGIDSGIVAALSARATGSAPLGLTVTFDEAHADERDLAGATARLVGLEQRLVNQPAAGLDTIDKLAWFFDEPFGDPSALPTFSLCEAAARHATVLLSGDGGDEAFAGYRRYVEAARWRSLISASGEARSVLRAVAPLLPATSLLRYRMVKLGLPDEGCAAAFDDLPADPALSVVVHPSLREALAEADAPLWERWRRSSGAPLTLRQQDLDYGLYLPDDILVKVDRASMAHSIEVRSPFLDVRLVEWAATLPRSVLVDRKVGKKPLRSLAARLLPQAVQSAEKRGFGVPLDDWFRTTEGDAFVRERLLGRAGLDRGFWTRDGVERILSQQRLGRGRGFGLILWRLLMLEAWSRHYAAERSSELRAPPRAAA